MLQRIASPTRELLAAYERNDLLTYASAIAFQVFFALIPFLLFVLGLLGGLGLDGVWTDDVAPTLRDNASPAAFEVVDSTVRNVLGGKQGFWLTIGLLITIWEMSGATRAIMGVFDRIYESEGERSFAAMNGMPYLFWKRRTTAVPNLMPEKAQQRSIGFGKRFEHPAVVLLPTVTGTMYHYTRTLAEETLL